MNEAELRLLCNLILVLSVLKVICDAMADDLDAMIETYKNLEAQTMRFAEQRVLHGGDYVTQRS